MRLVFMGTAEFAVPCLEAVAAAGHSIAAVVTQPDRPAGRGRAPRSSPVKQVAERLGLPVLQPEHASDPHFIEALRELAPRVLVVVAYGQILKQSVLDVPPLGSVNVHASLLPRYRGAAPIQRAIFAGETTTGVCTMRIDAGMDSGDVLLAERVPILADDTAGTLAERLAPRGAALLVRTLEQIEAGTATPHPQDTSSVTFAPRLTRDDSALCWSEPAEALRNRVRACNPAPGAFAAWRGAPVKIWRAETAAGEGAAGEVLALDERGIVVAAGTGALRLLEVQPAGRPRQPAVDFARGYRVAAPGRWADGPRTDNS